MRRTIAVVILLLALSALALAHGKEKHIMGTVTAMADNSITVETTAKKSFTVGVSNSTKFEKSGKPAVLKDLKVGDRVVISADEHDGKLTASHVRFGTMNAKQPMQGMKGMDHKQSQDHE